jgi:signal transduction histidine kinase
MLLLLAGVVIGAALASVAAVRFAAESRFRTFVSAGDAERAQDWAIMVSTYYGMNGSWDGVQRMIDTLYDGVGREGMGGMMREGRKAGPRRSGDPAGNGRPRVVLVDIDGTVVVDSSRLLVGTRLAADAGSGVPVMLLEDRIGTLFLGTMLEAGLADSGLAFLSSVTRAIVLAAGIAALLALAIGLLAVRRLTNPVAELTRAAERAGAGDLGVRVAVRGRDEIARLAETFNRMTGALRDQEEGRRRIVADSAHELRTPVSLIQGTVEAMLDGVYPSDRPTLEGLHEETLRLSRLVEDLNELSLLESGTLVLELEDADLAEISRVEAGRFATRSAEKGVTIAVEAAAHLPRAPIDRRRIGQVMANLLGNALRHTPAGGLIVVRVEAPRHDRLRLAVEDSGPGIPEAERAKVFERYYRVDEARAAAEGGRGLGLAIAAGIVKAHGGTVRAEASAALGGAMVVVELPGTRLDAAPSPPV